MSTYSVAKWQSVTIKRKQHKYAFLEDESHFSNSLLILLACIVKADDKQTDSELRYIENALLGFFPADRVTKMVGLVEQSVLRSSLDYRPVCTMVRAEFNHTSKIQLMHLLIGIAAADGLLTKTEEALIRDMAIRIRVPFVTYTQLLMMFNFRREGEQRREQKKFYSSKLLLSQAYGILGLTQNASVAEIKKAYRKLAMKHHPDRVIHLGEEYQKSAKEKFQTISDAYEYIKERKGFN